MPVGEFSSDLFRKIEEIADARKLYAPPASTSPAQSSQLSLDLEEEWEAAVVPPFHSFLQELVRLRDRGQSGFVPWSWQADLARALPHVKRVQFLKARQIGMSWILAAYALHTALASKGADVLLTSQTQPDAIELLARLRYILEQLPKGLHPPLGRTTTTLLQFKDRDSSIRALPSTERAGRGFVGRLVVADEHAFHRFARANMAALDPAIEAGGQFLACSSANGAGNLFAELWSKAIQQIPPISPRRVAGEWSFEGRLEEAARDLPPGAWLPVFLPYDLRPGRTAEWWEARRTISVPPWLIFQEYPRDPDEAFVQTGRPLFPPESLEAVREQVCPPLAREEWPEALRGEDPRCLRIWSPPAAGHRYCAGVDVAEGLEHGDFSDLCLLGVDEAGGPVEVLTFNGHRRPDELAALIHQVACLYPGVYGVEKNNHGLAVLLALIRLGCPGLYYAPAEAARNRKSPGSGRPGWLTTSASKALIIDQLEAALRMRVVRLRDELALPELSKYQQGPRGGSGAPAGHFDDRVMSRAIAVQMLQHLPPKSDEPAEKDGGTPVGFIGAGAAPGAPYS